MLAYRVPGRLINKPIEMALEFFSPRANRANAFLTKMAGATFWSCLLIAAICGCGNGTVATTAGACSGVDCGGHGNCVVTGGSPACDCESGFRPDGLACIPNSSEREDGSDRDDGGESGADEADGNDEPDREQGDTIPPSVPVALQLTATACGSVQLSWSPSTDTGGSGLKGYKLFLNGAFATEVAAPATSATITGLNASTSYSISVSALDNAGNESARSEVVSATTPPCPTTEFLVFRGDRTYALADNGFHYYYKLGQPLPATWPADWTTPVDYWGGVWQVRVTLQTSPKGNTFTLQPCIWMHDADGQSTTADELESCGGRLEVRQAGATYQMATAPLAQWWHKGGGTLKIDISRPHDFKRLGLVLRKPPDCYISSYNVSPNCWSERFDYLPFDFHLTIVAVAKDATFSGWSNY